MDRQTSRRSPRHRSQSIPPVASTNGRSAPPSAALRGAASAFIAHAPAAPIETSRVNGAKAAAALAGSRGKPRLQRTETEPSKDVGNRVRAHVQSIEQSSLRPDRQSTIHDARASRPTPARSPSQIAAQLALRNPTTVPSENPSPGSKIPDKTRLDVITQQKSRVAPPPKVGAQVQENSPPLIAPKPTRVISLALSSQDSDVKTLPELGDTNARSGIHGGALEAALGAFAHNQSRAPSFSAQSDISRSSSLSRSHASTDRDSSQLRGRQPSFLHGPTDDSVRSTAPRKIPRLPPFEVYSQKIRDHGSTVHGPSRGLNNSSEVLIPAPLDQKTGLTESALADAMVASSLASSRAPSPRKLVVPPPPLSRRHSKTRSLFHSKTADVEASRTPSPSKRMKQTLRKARSDEDSEEGPDPLRRGRRHLMRKHHKKHHEGDRKRWRDEVTDRQRRRYEGVWASNRGLYMPDSSLETRSGEGSPSRKISDLVVNLVVRDIWKRSRLPADVLEEVWNLVDTTGIGALSRDEFVAGMWLIDQRLRGRKLPIRVTPSVWASVRPNIGLQVSSKSR